MNEYDSAKLVDLLHFTLGFVVTTNANEANLIVFNTCSVREKAQEKFFSELGALHKLKQQKPQLVIAVGGCVATQEREKICRRAPDVDIVFGTQTWQRLPAMYQAFLTTVGETSNPDNMSNANGASNTHNDGSSRNNKKKRIIDTEFNADEKFSCLSNLASSLGKATQTTFSNNTSNNTTQQKQSPQTSHPATTSTPTHTTAYVAIMEGCNKFCSYCIVPYTRGREISRSLNAVLQEVRALISQGVKEICFLGQNVNNYRGIKTANTSTANLAELIRVTAQIPEIVRLRFMTSHPANFDDELIALYGSEPKLAAHLHLPVQSGSNRVLRAMHRAYTHEEYRSIIEKLRRTCPNISVSSDFIVGFPGEDEDDFLATMDLVKSIEFDHSFSFIYSPRPGTQATTKLEDNIPLRIKKQRLQILQQELNTTANKISAAMVGTMQKIIVTGLSRRILETRRAASITTKSKIEETTQSGETEQPEETTRMDKTVQLKEAARTDKTAQQGETATQLTGRTENNRVVNFIAPPHLIGQVAAVQITRVMTNTLQGKI